MSGDGVAAIRLADVLEALAEDRSADESVILTAACLVVARRTARLANSIDEASELAGIAAGSIGNFIAIEYRKLQLLHGV